MLSVLTSYSALVLKTRDYSNHQCYHFLSSLATIIHEYVGTLTIMLDYNHLPQNELFVGDAIIATLLHLSESEGIYVDSF